MEEMVLDLPNANFNTYMDFTSKVNVIITAFNHEKHIASAIESVLAQETNFSFKIIIGDDCSTDGTSEIIKDYQSREPQKIKAFFHPKNLGSKAATGNWCFLFKQVNAEYIALLDGDDYWTDSLKLQKQVDFLEKNEDYVICFHNVKVVYEDFPDKTHLFNMGKRSIDKETFTIHDIISDLALMHTSSVVFKNNLIEGLPDWFNNVRSGDIALFHLIAQHGKIGALKDVMSVYRKNKYSITNFSIDRIDTQAYIYLYNSLNKHFNYKYNRRFKKLLAKFYLQDCAIALKEQSRQEAKKSFASAMFNSLVYFLKNYRVTLSLFTQLYIPSVYRLIKSFKSSPKPTV